MWTVVILLVAAGRAEPQTLESGQVVPVDLVSPVYPPIAVSARVSGDVTVLVRVLPDGSITSAEAVSGPPLLTEVSLGAARASRFECQVCEGEHSHTIIYSFQFDVPRAAPRAGQAGSHVPVSAESPVVIPHFSSFSARSAKCLYLWRCGVQWGGMDFYNYKVRSARCAWLWKCGWRRRGS
jgi:hypothetical protein